MLTWGAQKLVLPDAPAVAAIASDQIGSAITAYPAVAHDLAAGGNFLLDILPSL
jgi:hypothetical protein